MKSDLLVRVYCGWRGRKSLLQQSPAHSGRWGNIRFYIDDESLGSAPRDVDYLVVYNAVLETIECQVPEGAAWMIAGEPPTDLHAHFKRGYHQYDRLITQHDEQLSVDHLHLHGALPWHIDASYDYLKTLPVNAEKKIDSVCAIVSNLNILNGHQNRLNFIEYCKSSNFRIEVFGRGIRALPNDNKFDVLYPCKYSIALENSYYDHYWTEKIADCYLSWTMPIYAGAPNILEYFPEESMILIDPKNPQQALKIIEEAVANDRWSRNLDAIEEARARVLDEYQFFPFISNLIRQHQQQNRAERESRTLRLSPNEVSSRTVDFRNMMGNFVSSLRRSVCS